MKLFIGNKNYSSWSFRPWIAMRAKGIEFEEVLVPFDDDGGNPAFREFSPTGKVPVFVDGEIRVWESLAILEHLADRFPDHGFWPEAPAERAMARAISAWVIVRAPSSSARSRIRAARRVSTLRKLTVSTSCIIACIRSAKAAKTTLRKAGELSRSSRKTGRGTRTRRVGPRATASAE